MTGSGFQQLLQLSQVTLVLLDSSFSRTDSLCTESPPLTQKCYVVLSNVRQEDRAAELQSVTFPEMQTHFSSRRSSTMTGKMIIYFLGLSKLM